MRKLVLLLVVLAAMVVAAPAWADGPVVETQVGTHGAVPPGRSFDVVVSATSDLLWQGSVVVEAGALRLASPVELPAGTTKATTVTMPPLPPGTTLRVFLESEDGTRTPVQRFGSGVAEAGVRVALLGVPGGTRDQLAATRTVPAGDPPTLVEVAITDLTAFDGYDYLVVASGFDASLIDVASWVERGGRLIGPPAVVAEVGAGGGATIGGLPVTPVGTGEVIAWEPTDTVDWSLVLRDTGTPVSAGNQGEWADPYTALGTAASGVAGSPLATMPGLLPGLALYVLVAGPVNLFILGRLRRRELAWVTVPVLAVVAVGALWVLGPRQQRVDISAAVVEVVTAEPVSHTALTVIPSGDGITRLGVDGRLVGGLGNRRGGVTVSAPNVVDIALATGQPTSVYAWGDAGAGLTATPSGNGWEVTNPTDRTFDVWGVVADGFIHTGMTPLEPGAVATTEMREQAFADPWNPPLMQVIWSTELGNSERSWSVYQPVMAAADALRGTDGGFVWGLVTDHQFSLEVEGRPREVDAVLMSMSPMADDDPLGAAQASVVTHEGLFQEQGGGVYYGDGSLTMAFRVDPASARVRITDGGWGMPIGQGFAFFDFSEGAFSEPMGAGTFDAAGFVGPSGDVFLQISVAGGEVWPATVQVEGLGP